MYREDKERGREVIEWYRSEAEILSLRASAKRREDGSKGSGGDLPGIRWSLLV